jgi:hypothetical protein
VVSGRAADADVHRRRPRRRCARRRARRTRRARQIGGIEEFESLVWLAHVEAARAAGVESHAARARSRLADRAATLTDPENALLAALCTDM